MSEFFCIYSGKIWPESERSVEHIVPYAIGGKDRLTTRDVARQPNNEMGRTADHGLINNLYMAFERWQHKVAAKDGRIPNLEFRGSTEIGGTPTSVSYVVTPDGSKKLRTSPLVETNWEAGTARVKCDKADYERIVRDLRAKAAKKGFGLTPRIEECASQTIETPRVATQFEIHLGHFEQGFVKMALGLGHLALGYSWSKSEHADKLRAALAAGPDASPGSFGIRGGVWPGVPDGIDEADFREQFSAGPSRHVIMLTNTGPAGCSILLFGKYLGMVGLAPSTWPDGIVPVGDLRIIVLDAVARQRWDFTLGQFVAARERGLAPFEQRA